MASNDQTELNKAEKSVIEQDSDSAFEDENEDWDDWREDDENDGGENDKPYMCLFLDSQFSSCTELFEHCRLAHKFDFDGIRRELGLDFYGSFKLINYVRSQVAENRCWSCGLACQPPQDIQNHSHETVKLKDIKPLWDDDKYLKPFMQDDPLLYSFNEDEEGEDNHMTLDEQEELMRDLRNIDEMCIEDTGTLEKSAHGYGENGAKEVASTSSSHQNLGSSSKMEMVNGDSSHSEERVVSSDGKPSDKHSKASIMNLVDKDIKKANANYFGAYSSFGIHREMISDKVRMDAYSQAILKNPSLLTGAVVMDVGCGTGILSLFAAKTGASRVIAVEASEKMASVATQIAKENGLWRCTEGNNQYTGVMEVVQGMVEEIDKSIQIKPHSVDVLLSEWMGYCLLYETMLSSVLFARDKWLKPGGAILPDTASIYAAGFGRGGTSLPFWEEVYGFNMSCVGKELVRDAAKFPIVDVVDEKDLVTDAVLLQTFDLATMKPDEVDFTASIELEPKSTESTSKTTWCYGVVLWFDTGFTPRFCKETPSVLSTSPYTPKTHWSQTIFTFLEPIAMAPGKPNVDNSAAVGTDACPASRIHLRISIARAVEHHRSIDISIETSGVDLDGRKRCWPVQMFNLS
ncbi:PREDICTED: probable protein arginine N-methyltransferase 3 [Populus euphratica]|uniref:Probable protein arginine N-methyltransferase 3 n=1 Tax=Populus euphratica TaxID=75702 RepID=A0AAJ6WZW2_POPEU|nr:PREDICTED: probable protein arginine N-methyltransferase 3 [Populus euphratica]